MAPHYYNSQAMLIDTVIAKNGNAVPTTIKHAREMKLHPGATELLKIFDKPAVTRWRVMEAIKTAINLPCNDGETTEQWINRIYTKSTEISETAKDFGSIIHGMIERHLKGEEVFGLSPEQEAFWKPIKAYLNENSFNGISEKRVVNLMGYGGTIDFVGQSHGDPLTVVDFKTQNTLNKKTINFYEEWGMQLSAYQQIYPGATCYSVVFSSDEPGRIESYKYSEEEMKLYWAIMKRLVEIFSLARGLRYSWWNVEGL